MDTQTAEVNESSIPAEAGSPASAPVDTEIPIVWKVERAPTWQQAKPSLLIPAGAPIGWLGWYKQLEDGTTLMVSNDELKAWEVVQRTPEGKDALRGVKLKARLDGVIASREEPAIILDSETSPAYVVAEADATGTP